MLCSCMQWHLITRVRSVSVPVKVQLRRQASATYAEIQHAINGTAGYLEQKEDVYSVLR